MKYSALLSVLGATAAFASPAAPLNKRACTSPVTLSGNPFTSRTLYANSRYASEVSAAANAITNATLKAQALRVGQVGTFLWL